MDKSGKQQNNRAFRTKFIKTSKLFVVVLNLLLFSSCGMEDYPFLNRVPAGNISQYLNERATIDRPDETNEFSHFTVFYRIYISDESIVSQILPSEMSRINTMLTSDYNGFEPYTTSDTISTSIGTLFANRKYYTLYVQAASINNILSSGQRIIIDFAQQPGRQPTITAGGTDYVLWRTTGNERPGESFTPQPDRFFINSTGLHSTENATPLINNDVVDKAVTGPRYTYVSMYIVATGYDSASFVPFYSQPTHIGVFRLPDPVVGQ
jgi:hypothetical protein